MKIDPSIPCQVFRTCRAQPEQIEQLMEAAESLHLTETRLCNRSLTLVKAFVAGGGELILDANHLTAFLNKTAINYEEVLQSHLCLVEQLPVADRVKVVAPYREDDLEASIVLQQRHQEALRRLAGLGVSFILPMAGKGGSPEALHHLEWFKRDIGPTILGLKLGCKQKDLLQVLQQSGCKRIHLLNAMSRPTRSLLKRMPEALSAIPEVSGTFQSEGRLRTVGA